MPTSTVPPAIILTNQSVIIIMAFIIRTADLNDPNDSKALLSLLTAQSSPPTVSPAELTPAAHVCLIPALLTIPDALILLAFGGGQAIGSAICLPQFSINHARYALAIHRLIISPDGQQQAIETRLLTTIKHIARRRGYCKILLTVPSADIIHRRLYYQLGYDTNQPPMLNLENCLDDPKLTR
ncbi:GNAT family N-acetyltransferase [Thiospirillum jenense]|uniref:GNAT family N-acetyltransferase n=1 Tax=Thiospirillum jenense TaxID=1653858 RepID=A0A839HF71_9GAMM|nr:GNAT family N-acetyltransferase [Thiospirillum jenense]MBB1125669.1 GNAT family N-acetyltransferase [Thiospirillum jenense]